MGGTYFTFWCIPKDTFTSVFVTFTCVPKDALTWAFTGARIFVHPWIIAQPFLIPSNGKKPTSQLEELDSGTFLETQRDT